MSRTSVWVSLCGLLLSCGDASGEASAPPSLVPLEGCAQAEWALKQQLLADLNRYIDEEVRYLKYNPAPQLFCIPPSSPLEVFIPVSDSRAVGVEEEQKILLGDHLLYAITGRTIVLLDTTIPAQTHEVARIDLAGQGKGMTLIGSRLVVTVIPDGGPEEVRWLVIDVADPASPQQVRELKMEGVELQTFRLGTTFHATVQQRPLHPDLPPSQEKKGQEEPPYPPCYTTLSPAEREQVIQAYEASRQPSAQNILNTHWDSVIPPLTDSLHPSAVSCPSVLNPSDGGPNTLPHERGFTTILSFDPTSDAEARLTTVLARAEQVHVTPRSLYLAVQGQSPSRSWTTRLRTVIPSDGTFLHRFSLGEGTEAPRYEAGVRLPGWTPLSGGLEEHDQRLYTSTTYLSADQSPRSVVRAFSHAQAPFEDAGRIDDLAHASTRLARFEPTRGYVFTDDGQLHLLDLGTMGGPLQEASRLAYPGNLTGLRPVSETRLLALSNATWVVGHSQFRDAALRLLDVTDLAHPALLPPLVVATDGLDGKFDDELRSTTLLPDHGWLATRLATCPRDDSLPLPTFDGLLWLDVNSTQEPHELGRLEHTEDAHFSATFGCSRVWQEYPVIAWRTLVQGDTVYSLSSTVLTVSPLQTPGAPLLKLTL